MNRKSRDKISIEQYPMCILLCKDVPLRYLRVIISVSLTAAATSANELVGLYCYQNETQMRRLHQQPMLI